MIEERIRITKEELLSDNWYILKRFTFELRRQVLLLKYLELHPIKS